MFGILRTPSVSIFRHRMPPTAPSVRYSAGAKRCEGEDGAEMVRRLLPSFSFSLIAAGCRYGDDRLKVLGIFLMILVGVLNVSCPVPSMDSSTLSALILAGESGSAVGTKRSCDELAMNSSSNKFSTTFYSIYWWCLV